MTKPSDEMKELHVQCMNCGAVVVTTGQDVVNKFREMLATVRRETLEEAARLIEGSVSADVPEFINQRLQALHDAKICRSMLEAKP